jgi:nucleoid-associated protein YgaU
MTDPAIKFALASCVVIVGVCSAVLSRSDYPQPAPPPEMPPLLDCRTEPQATISPKQIDRSALIPIPAQATVVTPLDSNEPAPALPLSFPESKRQPERLAMMLPVAAAADQSPRTHTIVDGDTLAALAERYLGSADRAEEIYRANRDVLHDPRLLPVGRELKIPPRRDVSSPLAPSQAR